MIQEKGRKLNILDESLPDKFVDFAKHNDFNKIGRIVRVFCSGSRKIRPKKAFPLSAAWVILPVSASLLMSNSQIMSLVGWFGLVLLAMVVVRVMRNGVAGRFPWFAAYLTVVFASSVLAWWIYSAHSSSYGAFYWISEVASFLLGVAVSSEILRKAFAGYPAIRDLGTRLFRVLLGAALLRVALMDNGAQNLWYDLERDVRILQALLLMAIALLALYYSIRLDVNQLGILIGYGLFVSFAVINLALRSHVGTAFQSIWSLMQPVQYVVCEAIWCVTLWTSAPLAPSERAPWTQPAPAEALEANLRRLRAQLNFRGTA
jgi:hypothetical protein